MQTETTYQTSTSLRTGLWLGALTSVAVIAVLYAGSALAGLPFVPFDIFDWMARVLPGGLISFVIQTMVALIGFLNLGETSSVAKTIEQLIAILQLVAGGAVFGAVLAAAGRRNRGALPLYGLMGGLVLLAATLAIKSSLGFEDSNPMAAVLWLALVFLLWGWLLGVWLQLAGPALAGDAHAALNRRQFLNLAWGGSLVTGVAALGLGRLFGGGPTTTSLPTDTPAAALPGNDDPYGAALTNGPAASPSPEALAARPAKAIGTRDELTHIDDFYRIDINTLPARINGDSWRLQISGLVNTPLELSLQDLAALPATTQILTMQCVSNPVGGDLTGTTRWSGPRLKDVLALAGGLETRARTLKVEAADGFFEYVSLADIEDDRTLLVYLMNGEPLPTEHGFPLRVYIPNRYGMKQPKWITRMEAVDADTKAGYWVVRGWDEEAYAKATSVIDTIYVDSTTTPATVQVGGIAWAGERGISKVEVQVDDAEWAEATLINPPLSPLAWVQWRYDWPYAAGEHIFKVRSYETDGSMQVTDLGSARPSGATGVHARKVNL